MIWTVSDLMILLLTAALVINAAGGAALFLCRKLERVASMGELSGILKGIILYTAFGLPVMVGVAIFKFTFVGRSYVVSEDLEHGWIMRHVPFSIYSPWWVRILFWVLCLVWLLGLLWFGARKLRRTGRLLKRLEATARQKEDEVFEECVEKVFGSPRKGRICLYGSDFVPSPFIYGWVKKRILLPAMDFSERERRLIYEHELVHCKKGDYFFRQLVFWLCAIYWFNPGIYVLADYFVDVNEMACDEAVLKKQEKGMAYWYAMLIYRISVDPTGEALEVIKFTGCGKSKLERRIKRMKRKTNRKAYVVVLASALMATAFPATALGASAGMAALQGYCAEGLRDYYAVEAEPQKRPVHQEYTIQLAPEDVKIDPSVRIEPKGSTSINESLDAKEDTSYGIGYLTKGQRVTIHLAGDTGSVFRAGLTAPGGSTTYVNSIGGEIDHTFSVTSSGNYSVYLQNLGSSAADIDGMVLVRD